LHEQIHEETYLNIIIVDLNQREIHLKVLFQLIEQSYCIDGAI